MNLIFDISQINLDNMIFSDSKKNIIMDGSFTKIIYSNEFVSLNGIYIYFPIIIQSIEQCSTKQIIKYNIYVLSNSTIIKAFSLIETQILEVYKQFYKCDKLSTLILHDHLTHGNIKINMSDSSPRNSTNKSLILKISGIWENSTHIGITYKII